MQLLAWWGHRYLVLFIPPSSQNPPSRSFVTTAWKTEKSLQTLSENLVMIRMNCDTYTYFIYSKDYFLGLFFSALSDLREVCRQGTPDERVFLWLLSGGMGMVNTKSMMWEKPGIPGYNLVRSLALDNGALRR